MKKATLIIASLAISGLSIAQSTGPNLFPLPDGNVGIGTLHPNQQLHLFNPEPNNTFIKIENTNSLLGGLFLGIEGDNSGIINLKERKALKFFTGNNEKMRISKFGDIGIGLTNPKGKLDIDLGGAYHTKEAGVRITVPNRVLVGGTTDEQNRSIFEIRRNISGNLLPTTYRTEFILDHENNVGIGLREPNSKLHVHNGRIQITGNNTYGGPMLLFGGAPNNAPNGQWGIEYISVGQPGLNFWKPSGSANGGNYKFFIADNGKVSIGLDPNNPNNFPTATLEGDYNLYVGLGILTERVKVALRSSADWADYVFKEDYNLMSLSNVESFIAENGHLPNVPSAEEVVETGIDMAKMDAKLLEKIEELTLYTIQQEDEIKNLESVLKKLNEQVQKLVLNSESK